jgi:hypothetical protein
MVQDIVAYLIILAAISFFVYNILLFFGLVRKKSDNKSKCIGCSSSCEIKEIRQLGANRLIRFGQFKFYL